MSVSSRLIGAGLVALALSVTASADAQQRPELPLTWENVFTRSTGARQAVLSPDGRTAAVAASTVDGLGIFLVAVDGTDIRMLVEGGSSPVRMPDGIGLLFSGQSDRWVADLIEVDPASAESCRMWGFTTGPTARPETPPPTSFVRLRKIFIRTGHGGSPDEVPEATRSATLSPGFRTSRTRS